MSKLATMDLFTQVENAQVILIHRGVYRQADLFQQGGHLFAGLKDGFARLLVSENTTVHGLKWKTINGILHENCWDGPRIVQPKVRSKPKLKVAQ